MRIVHLSYSDIGGGAARGSYALHRALLEAGVDSLMLVEQKLSADSTVSSMDSRARRIIRPVRERIDNYPVRLYRSREASLFSPALAPSRVARKVRELRPSIVHLHWVGGSFVRPEDLAKFRAPIVWTLRDMWPFTGGCHYAPNCDAYEKQCGACPSLGSGHEHDLAWLTWVRKSRAWRSVSVTPVGISGWMTERARSSALFRGRDVRTINNAINTDVWKPIDRREARGRLGIPADRWVVLFIALSLDEPRKGYRHFQAACERLEHKHGGRLHALVVGDGGDGRDLAIDTTFAGKLSRDADIRDAYNAADVAVVPSTAEAFGKTAAELLACGTPAVVFDGTGLADVVDHLHTGYLAAHGSSDALADGVAWVLADRDRWRQLSDASRDAALGRFTTAAQAQSYGRLYAELLEAG